MTRPLAAPRRLALALLLAALLAGPEFGWAQQSDTGGAVLTIAPLAPVPANERAELDVALADSNGAAIADSAIEIFVDGEYVRRERTDEDGRARIRLSSALGVGSHDVTAIAVEIGEGNEIRSDLELTVRPLSLEIETVPPLAGIPFRIDGTTIVTGADGVAVADWLGDSVYQVTMTLEDQHAISDDTRITFDRWGDAEFRPQRSVNMRRGDRRLQIGFALSHPIPIRFVDLQGQAVDWDEITSVTLKSSSAAYRTVSSAEPYWLQANRIMRQSTGIFPTPLLWSVESVIKDGSNVVNRYQQRFMVAAGDRWTLQLLLYSARFRSRDALLGFSVGTGVTVTYPDNETVEYAFDENREVQLHNLARGLYRVQVVGIGGVAPLTPVALSRDQDVQLKVLTTLDIWLGIGTAAILAFGLLFLGRPHLIGLARRSSRDRATPATVLPSKRPVGQGLHSAQPTSAPAARWLRRSLLLASSLALLLAATSRAQEGGLPENFSDLLSGETGTRPWLGLDPRDPVPMLAHYYIWFAPQSWDRAKTDFPLLGRYSSDDREVMRRHIAMAKEAGIDGFMVSWKSTFDLDRRLELLVAEAEAQDFKLWIVYQGLDFDREPLDTALIETDLRYFVETFAQRPAFLLFDRPVVVWSGTWEFSRREVETIAQSFRHELYLLASERSVEGYERLADFVDGNVYYWSSVNPLTMPNYQERLDALSAVVHRSGGLWVAPAAPGFDARLLGGATVVERDDGATFRRQLDAALRSSPDAIGLISWNEFSENTHIEPSERYGNRALEVLADRELSAPPRVLDFDSSAPGTTDRNNYNTLIVIGALMALIAASLVTVYLRDRRSVPRPGTDG